MIWEGVAVVHRADVKVPETFRHARKSPLVAALSSDLEVLKRHINRPVVRKHEHGGLELLAGQKRVAANDRKKLESLEAEIVVCSDEEADFIREAENTHRLHNETKKDREAWDKSSLELVEKRKALLEAQRGEPVKKAEAIEEVARERGILPGSVAQQNRRERRKKDSKPVGGSLVSPAEEGNSPARQSRGDSGSGQAAGSELGARISQPAASSGFSFDFLDTEERQDVLGYVTKVHGLLLSVAEHAKAAEEALSAIFALSGEDQNPDPQLMGLSYYTVILSQLHETALASLPRSICPDCKGSDSTCETCSGSIWVP